MNHYKIRLRIRTLFIATSAFLVVIPAARSDSGSTVIPNEDLQIRAETSMLTVRGDDNKACLVIRVYLGNTGQKLLRVPVGDFVKVSSGSRFVFATCYLQKNNNGTPLKPNPVAVNVVELSHGQWTFFREVSFTVVKGEDLRKTVEYKIPPWLNDYYDVWTGQVQCFVDPLEKRRSKGEGSKEEGACGDS